MGGKGLCLQPVGNRLPGDLSGQPRAPPREMGTLPALCCLCVALKQGLYIPEGMLNSLRVRKRPVNTALCKWQTCKIFCSSWKLELGEFLMNRFSMLSMASRVCKENKGVAVDLQSLFLCQEKDLNADCQGRTRVLPGRAHGEAWGRKAAACRAACGQLPRKGKKG